MSFRQYTLLDTLLDTLLGHALPVVGIVLVASLVPNGAMAQADKFDKPVDLKALVPPVFTLPPSSQINPGAIGGTATPGSPAPLQNPSQSPTQSAPGFRLSVPSR